MDDPGRQKGQGLVEYVLIFGLIGVVTVVALLLVGRSVENVFSRVTEQMMASGTSAGNTAGSMFFDAFDSSNAWQEIQGKWEMINGQYRNVGTGEHRSFAFSGDTSWTDYAVEVTAQLVKGDGYGVYFRTTNPKAANGYVFQYDPGYGTGEFIFRRVQNGSETSPIARVKAPAGYDWYNQARTIKIEASGSNLIASIDGVPVLQAKDSTFTNGAVGLRTWDNTQVFFDDVRVTSLD